MTRELLNKVVDFIIDADGWEDAAEDTVVYTMLESYTAEEVLSVAHQRLDHPDYRQRLDYMDHAEFIGRVRRIVTNYNMSTEFINDTFWNLMSECLDKQIIEGEWDFVCYDDDDQLTPVSYEETRKCAEWRVMYNLGHDLHWAWRDTYNGSLDDMVDYVLSRVYKCYPKEWEAQNYPPCDT